MTPYIVCVCMKTMAFCPATKKNVIMLFARKRMQLEIVTLIKINCTQKDKLHLL